MELGDYPDQAAAAYILNGLCVAFYTGCKALSVSLWSPSNMRSAFDHTPVINDYFENEVSYNWAAGPFTSPPFTELHISCFGVVPKGQPAKKMAPDSSLFRWLSHPGSSIQFVSTVCRLLFSYVPNFWVYTYEVLNGSLGRSSSCATASRWWLFCLLVPSKTLKFN